MCLEIGNGLITEFICDWIMNKGVLNCENTVFFEKTLTAFQGILDNISQHWMTDKLEISGWDKGLSNMQGFHFINQSTCN